MRRRAFRAPFGDLRCQWDITRRQDGSDAQCMRSRVIGHLCTQHARMLERQDFSCCGGNDAYPKEHTMDCETRPEAERVITP